MNKTITILFIFILGSIHAQQNQGKQIKKNVVLIHNAPVQPISGNKTPIALQDSSVIKSRIAAIESHIHAIDVKVAYVKSDQAQKERAEQMGWFEQMANIKSELIEEKTSLSLELGPKK